MRQVNYTGRIAACISALILSVTTLQASAASLSDGQFSGQINIEHRQFFSQGQQEQDNWQSSVMVNPEWYWDLNGGDSSFTFSPFYRYDAMDDERSHTDIREMYYLNAWNDYEFRVGINKVFWGVTESAHLVDVVNQTDVIEALDGEEKLGQPMIEFTSVKEWGTTDLILMPYFRERTYSGKEGRLRPALLIDTDNPLYESSQEERHVDYALRYTCMLGDWDLGISYMQGTDRDPYLLYKDGRLHPYYAQMKHTGLDVQGVVGDWLWKLETIYRDSRDNYIAAVTGFEYTWVGALGLRWDIGLISEYLYDSRDENAASMGQNDWFGGIRLAFNDEDSTEILTGITQDLNNQDVYVIKMEASSRINNHFSTRIEAWLFENRTAEDLLYSFRKDDFMEFSIEYYF